MIAVGKRGRAALQLATLATGIASSHPDVFATQKTFSPANGAWLTSTNWTPTGVPTSTDDVLVAAGTTTMTLTASNMTIQYITYTDTSSRPLENSTGTTNASNLTLGTVDANGNLINVNPASGTPRFTIRNGATAALNLVLGANGNFNVNGIASLTISSNINQSGTRTLTKTGLGTLLLSGTNGYTGDTNVNGGVLKIDSDAAALTATTYRVGGGILEIGSLSLGTPLTRPVSLNSGGLRANRAANSTGTFSGVVTIGNAPATTVTLATATATQALSLSSGAANGLTGGASDTVINVLGPGTISLNDTSNYAGKWRIAGGTLQTNGTPGNLGTAPVSAVANYVELDGGAIALGSSSHGSTRGFTISAGIGTMNVSGGNTSTINGIVAGPGSLFKTNGGTLELANSDNSYAGSTNILEGVVSVVSGAPLGTAPSTPTDNIFLGGGTLLFTGSVTGTPLSANRRVVLGPSGGTGIGTIDIADTKTVRVAGDLKNNTGGTGNLGKAGLGTLILEGDGLYTGTTHIGAGTLQLGNGGTGGSLGSGNVSNNAALTVNRSNLLTLTNDVSGTGSVNQSGTGMTTLSGNNSYTGVTRVLAGTLRLGSATALGTTAAGTSVASGATLDLFGQTIGAETITSIAGTGASGNGALINSHEGIPASLSGNITMSADTSIGGVGNFTLSGVIDGNFALTKVLWGTVTLANSNTYSGSTTINGGTIIASTNLALPESANVIINNAVLDTNNVYQQLSGLTMTDGKVLGASGFVFMIGNVTASGVSTIETPLIFLGGPRMFTVTSNSELTAKGAISNFLSVQNVTKVGAGTMIVTAASSNVGEYYIIDGTLQTTGNGNLNSSVTVDSAGHLRLDSTSPNNLAVTTVNSSTISGTGGFVIGSSIQSTGTSFIHTPVSTNGPISVNSGELTMSGALNGAFINKQGSGTLTLTSDGNVQNGIFAGAGAVQIGDGGTTGVPGNDQIQLTGGEVVVNRSNALTISNNIVGGSVVGGLRHKGTGATTLTGNNSYSAQTFIDNGTLVIASGHSGAGAYFVGPNGSLAGGGGISVTADQSVTIQGNVSPGSSAGNLTLQTFGTGVTELAQGGSYTWEINNEAGTPGTNWDVLTLTAVSVTANAGANNTGGFTIKITSLEGITWTNTVGNREFTIATSTNQSFAGVDLDRFKINTDNFAASNLGGFYLKVGNDGGSLDLVYVPEPSSVVGVMGATGAMMRRRRRGK